MPLFDYVCTDCEYQREHFVLPNSHLEKKCPNCASDRYIRQLSAFRVDVEYSNPQEHYNKKIVPGINETYQQIGKEALNNDTKTLDNVFGTNKVKDTLND